MTAAPVTTDVGGFRVGADRQGDHEFVDSGALGIDGVMAVAGRA